jgi:outer membrane protein assembly factor BamB
VFSSPAVANGVVYVGSEDGKLYAFNAAGTTNCSGAPKTCSPLWSASAGTSVDSSPAVANGVVYVGSIDGNMYAFDVGTGGPLWSATTGDVVASSPAVADGVVYVGSSDGKLYAFGLPSALAAVTTRPPNPSTLHPDYRLKPTSAAATSPSP